MAHDASNNSPAKETLSALVGIVLLLLMIVAIGFFAWLRPAGEHQPTAVEKIALESTDESTDESAVQASTSAVAEAKEALDQTPSDTQAPTEAVATTKTPAVQDAPAQTTNEAPVAESVEQQQEAEISQ